MNVSSSIEISAPVESVWATLRDFGALQKWAKGVKKSSGSNIVGGSRELTTDRGDTFIEKLELLDDDDMTLAYSIVSGPLPVKNYIVKQRVTRDGQGAKSIVHWACDCEADGAPEEKVQQVIEAVVNGGLKSLKQHCELDATDLSLKKLKPES